jgi:mannose-1-phosphate guanylyltransferase
VKAILLAAGLGTRLQPLTYKIPKCLVPIKGRPLLEIWLQRLSSYDLGPFIINTHYLKDSVREFIKASEFSNKVKLVNEEILLGTAGTLINNLEFFENNDGMLIHADNFCLADFNLFLKAHESRPSECLMTMMTFRAKDPSSCGIVELDDRNIVKAFFEKSESPPGNIANGAIYALSSEFIELIRKDFSHVSDFSTEIIPHFMGKILSFEINETFIDIGTPQAYELANKIE